MTFTEETLKKKQCVFIVFNSNNGNVKTTTTMVKLE